MLASELVAQVRLDGDLTPDTLDADVLSHADMEIKSRLLPWLRNINDEFLVRSLDVASINGRVALPARAAGASLRLVQLITTNGQLVNLPRCDPAQDPGPVSSGQPWGFYLDAGGIVLLPLGTTATLRLRYFARPGKLVLETDTARCARITSVTPGATTTDVTNTTYGGGTQVDIVSSGPAHQHVAIAATYTGGPSPVTFQNSALLEQPAVGDYIALPDYSPFVALPDELGSVLVLATAARILRATGYRDEADALKADADAAQVEAAQLLRPRADGNPKRLVGGTLARMGSSLFDTWSRW